MDGVNPGMTPDVGAEVVFAGVAAGMLRTCPGLIRLGLVTLNYYYS